jgi:hypothetical protein
MPDIDLKPKTASILEGLSDYLKDPANFDEINKKILNTFISTCGHAEILDWVNCKKCTAKMLQRRKMLKSLGFKNPAQYFAWKKIHTTIRQKFPLMDWKTGQQIK